MKVKSGKAKGRRLQNWVRSELLSGFKTLTDNDISCAIMGESGADIKLSNVARMLIPYCIECKNKESFKGIYDIIKQANENSKTQQIPLGINKKMKKDKEKKVDFNKAITIFISPTDTGFACGVSNEPIDSEQMGILMTLARGMMRLALQNPDFVFDEGIKDIYDNSKEPRKSDEVDFSKFLEQRKNKLN